MNYLTFKSGLQQFPVFSLMDILKLFPNFDKRRLVEWQNKGYIERIRNKYYYFKDKSKDENFLFYSANKIYPPSYVSFESALSYYNLIPEGVFTITSATTNKTNTFDTPLGRFKYYSIQPSMYFGYKPIYLNGFPVLIADPEKVLLDYVYLNKISDYVKIGELRINSSVLSELINQDKLNKYKTIINSKTLDLRFNNFINTIFMYD